MNFEEIMMEITRGLTGEREHDVAYLKEQCEKYKTHDLAQEILRACGRLMYKYVTKEQKAELDRIVENQNLGHEAILEEVRFKTFQKKYDEALVLMESLVERIEQPGFFNDDAVSEYRCFNEFFEEALYNYYTKPEKTVRHPPIPFDAIYLQYGSLLVDMKKLDDAQEALKKAMRWNPANADIAFEHAETFKMKGDIESFFHLTVAIFQYAFKPYQVAHCYRNLGYYFVEKQAWQDAIACYTMSLQFEKDSKNAMSELYYIHDKVGDIGQPSMADFKRCAEKNHFPVGAHEDVIGIAYSYGKHFLEQKNIEAARYCFEIAYSLTDDVSIKKILDSLPKAEA